MSHSPFYWAAAFLFCILIAIVGTALIVISYLLFGNKVAQAVYNGWELILNVVWVD